MLHRNATAIAMNIRQSAEGTFVDLRQSVRGAQIGSPVSILGAGPSVHPRNRHDARQSDAANLRPTRWLPRQGWPRMMPTTMRPNNKVMSHETTARSAHIGVISQRAPHRARPRGHRGGHDAADLACQRAELR